MAQTIKLKRSATQGAVPSTSDLALGELAVNTYDGKIYIKKDSGTESIVEVGASGSNADTVDNLHASSFLRSDTSDIASGSITFTAEQKFGASYSDPDSGVQRDAKFGTNGIAVSGGIKTDSLTTSGNISFGDNDKAIFGAGSDLQIYFDGNNGVINETSSTGSLLLQGSHTRIKNANGLENMAEFISNGAVKLYYNNAQKLATTSTGIDVTGTATMDGLTVDGNAQVSNIGVGGTPNIHGIYVYHTDNFEAAKFQTNLGGSLARFTDTTASIEMGVQGGKPVIRTSSVARLTVDGANVQINSGALQMGSTTVIDSSRNLTNIGTISSGNVTSGSINATSSSEEVIRVNTTGNSAAIHFRDSGTIRGLVGFSNGSSIYTGADDHDMVFRSESKLHLVSSTNNLGLTLNGNSATFSTALNVTGALTKSGSTVWNAGNDGSGSGLDADTLDGQHGSYYATSSHNHSGVYTPYDHFRHTGHGNYTSTTTSALLTEALGDDAFDSKLTAHKTSWSYAGNGDLTDAGRLTELAGTSWLWWTDNSTDNVQGNITGLVIAPNTGGSAGKMFVYNNQGSSYAPGWREIWTSTSDGSGSGLDADTLDGQHASAFQASGTYNTIIGTDSDINTSGSTIIDNIYVTDGVITSMGTRTLTLGDLGYTGETNATADQTASEILTAIKTVDGSGSGLDADTVDGLQASQFLRADASDTTTGSLTINGDAVVNKVRCRTGQNLILNAGEANSHASGQTAEYVYINAENGLQVTSSPDNWGSGWGGRKTTIINDANGNSTFGGNITVGSGTSSYINMVDSDNGNRSIHCNSNYIGFLKQDGSWGSRCTDDGSWQILGNTAWHAGNDGSGSGLDADTLDGQHGSYYYSSANLPSKIKAGGTGPSTEDLNTVGNNVSVGQLEYRGFNSSSSNAPPMGDNANGVITVGQHSGNYNAQLAFSSNGNMYWRDNPSTSNGSWRKVWDSGNDGSGSGLDADTVDGVHESALMRRSANSQLDMNNNDIIGVDQIVHEGDTDTYMQFHAADQWRVVTGGTERFEVNNSNVTVNKQLLLTAGTDAKLLASGQYGHTFMDFRNNTDTSSYGFIYHSGSSMVYGTSSDYRLKENVVPLEGASEKLKLIPVWSFNFIEDPSRTVDGFLAHELQEHIPEAVVGEKDGIDEDGNPEYQAVDQSKLTPLLTAALQEALAKIEELEQRIENLENN